jgi:hypothetical protein
MHPPRLEAATLWSEVISRAKTVFGETRKFSHFGGWWVRKVAPNTTSNPPMREMTVIKPIDTSEVKAPMVSLKYAAELTGVPVRILRRYINLLRRLAITTLPALRVSTSSWPFRAPPNAPEYFLGRITAGCVSAQLPGEVDQI